MSEIKNKPRFEKRIFWDVNFETLDYDKRASFVIERVFERGDVEDIRQCRRYYGDELIKNVLVNAKYLPQNRLHLISAIFEIPIQSFRCYTTIQLNPKLFPY